MANDADIKTMIQHFDSDANGFISLDEFVDGVAKSQGRAPYSSMMQGGGGGLPGGGYSSIASYARDTRGDTVGAGAGAGAGAGIGSYNSGYVHPTLHLLCR